MDTLKHAVVDICVTAIIIAAAATDWSWARWIVLIYTPLIIVLKIAAIAASGTIARLKKAQTGAPRLLFHFLYALNVVALAAAGWWYLCAGWIVIWVLSTVQERRTG